MRTKERKTYADDVDDDDIEGKRNFNIQEKLDSKAYNANFAKLLKGTEVTLDYVQENGFLTPLLVLDKTGLGMRVPSQNFKVADVKQCVGSRRMLDVMDVNTQQALEMSMRDWVKYYENPERDRLLNVISLEFSHTRLDNYVEQPNIVKQMDWVETVWPRYLKECQTEATNIIEKMKYPKVQKYCLMSVGGCYTDFHIDFGGTSVWYHILHGKKIFWLIPPTDKNLEMYENWIKSGKQGDVFFADQVEECQRVDLSEGTTFFIPTGWIHAVYTPVDSLVFGGNFIHSFNIPMQLKIAAIENKTYVPTKFRYPFFGEMLWYVCERYVSIMVGKDHRQKSKEELREEEESKHEEEHQKRALQALEESDLDKAWDFSGVKREEQKDSHPDFSPPRSPILEEHSYVCSPTLPYSPMSLPSKSPLRSDSEESASSHSGRSARGSSQGSVKKSSKIKASGSQSDLIKPVSVKLEKCSLDREERPRKVPKRYLTKYEIEGLAALVQWLENLPPSKKCVPKDIPNPEELLSDMKKLLAAHGMDDQKLAITGEPILKWKKKKVKTKGKSGVYKKKPKEGKGGANSNRRRRTRCRKCEPCTRPECGECRFCKDMRKFGGPGRMKQCCMSKQCWAPVLPTMATCMLCNKDGLVRSEDYQIKLNLMECCICWEIVHPECFQLQHPEIEVEGNINEDLPNSWECPKCTSEGKQGPSKARLFKGFTSKKIDQHRSSASSDASEEREEVKLGTTSSDVKVKKEIPEKKPKTETTEDKRTTRSEQKSRTGATPEVKKEKSSPAEKDENQSVNTRATRGRGKREAEDDAEEAPKKKVKHESRSKSPLAPQHQNSKEKHKPSKSKSVSPPRKTATIVLHRSPAVSPKPPSASQGPSPQKGKTPPGLTGGLATALSPQRITSRGRQAYASTRGCARITCSITKREPPDDYPLHSTNEAASDSVDSDLLQQWSKSSGDDHTARRVADIKIPSQVYVVRPAPGPAPLKQVRMEDGSYHPLPHELWHHIFSYLPPASLCACMSVCCIWYQWCMHPALWRCLDLSWVRPIKQAHLIAIVKRQPKKLKLDATNIASKQLKWLLPRLPHLKHLSMGMNSAAAVHTLCSVHCPLLEVLDLGCVEVLNDALFQLLLSAPHDHRPGVDNSTTRLRNLSELSVAGTDITDASMTVLSVQLPKLKKLNMSYCIRITDAGMGILCGPTSTLHRSLSDLDLTGCTQLTEKTREVTAHIPRVISP